MLRRLLLFGLVFLVCCKAGVKPKQTPQQETSKTFVVEVSLYKSAILFLIEEDTLKARDFTRSVFDEDSTITGKDFFVNDGTTFVGEGGNILVWLPKEPNTIEGESTLNHELLHATIAILRRAGITLSEDSEEAYTYLLQYLTIEFYNKILLKESL